MQRKSKNPTIEYLNQAYELNRSMEYKGREIQRLREQAERATSTFRALRVSGTKDHDGMANAVAEITDIALGLERDLRVYTQKYREIQATIEAVGNPVHRELLSLRYLSFKRWEEIAVIMGYSWRHVMRVHGDALKDVMVCHIDFVI